MLRALNLLLSPAKTWERMALKPPGMATILIVSLLPLLAVTLAIEGYGLLKLGEATSEIGTQLQLPTERVIRYGAFYAVASLVVIIAGSLLLKSVAESFGVNTSFATSFILIGCGFMPIFLLRVLDAIPQMNTWICWGIGAALSVRILYHGVALWLKPEQTKGFGLFLVSVVYTVVLSGFVHFAAIQVLHGRLLKNVYPDREGAVAMARAVQGHLLQADFGRINSDRAAVDIVSGSRLLALYTGSYAHLDLQFFIKAEHQVAPSALAVWAADYGGELLLFGQKFDQIPQVSF